MNRFLISTFALAAAMSAFAGDGLDPGSKARLRSMRNGFSIERNNSGEHRLIRRTHSNSAKTVGGFLTLNPGYSPSDLSGEPITLTETRSGFLLVRMNVEDVERISTHPAVSSLRLEKEMTAKMDKVRPAIGADKLHRGEIYSHSYTGKGVLCAAVDGGFDPNHLNFLNEDGTSRIQNFTYFRPTQGGQSVVTENYGPEYIPVIDTENDQTFHGTHTVGIMAGSYRGKVKAARIDGDLSDPSSCRAVTEEIDNPYYGIAYGADIALASGAVSDYYIAQGVEEILNYAWNRQNQLGKPYPVVINISMGSNVGPHDGSSMLPKYLDSVVEEDYTNNVVCIAAGNEGNLAIALNKTLTEENSTVLTGLRSFNVEPDEYPNVVAGQVYVYSDTDEPFELQATVYNKERGSVVFRAVAGIPTKEEVGSEVYYATSNSFTGGDSDIISPQLAQYFEGYLGAIGFYDFDESGRYMGVIDAMLWETASNKGNYVIVVQAKGKPGQRIDFYCDGQFFDFSDLGLADKGLLAGTTDGTIADTATGKNVVVVGSYNTRDAWASLDNEIYSYDLFGGNEVSPFSSWGTLADGRELPTVCAPGATVISSTNEYYLKKQGLGDEERQAGIELNGRRYSWQQCVGTSMATPVVSGTIALWKEADPTLRYDDVLDIIKKTSKKDEDVLSDPANRVKWGAGKIDAYSGLIEVLRRQGIDAVTDITANPGRNFLIRSEGGGRWFVMAAGADEVAVDIYSLSGAAVKEAHGHGGEVIVDLSDLEKGIYLMNVNGVHTQKVVVN